MRRTSVSLPTKQVAHDPYEKPDRYVNSSHDGGFIGKMKDNWSTQSSRMRWMKMGAIAITLICLFMWFSPSGVQVYSPVGGGGQVPADASYGTEKCTQSYSKDKPIVQYVLMIDAGSTGSRIHVYKFNNCGPTPELESEEFKMTEKSVGGLSAFKDDPIAAAKSLDPLMQVAMDNVPDKLKGCSPVAVKATAGLRKVGTETADEILAQVRKHLEDDYPFPVVSKENDGVVIMPGSEEGVYAWVTTNYLLGNIGGPEKTDTAAVFDLGGGSTQIVFQPDFKEGVDALDGGMSDKLETGEYKYKYELDFGGRKFELYQWSHLDFGLMAARETIHSTLIADLIESKGADKTWMKKPITHPCFSVGMSKEITVDDKTYNFTGPANPSPAQCRALAEKILHKDASCEIAPCSFNGIYQPPLSKTFAKEDLYIFSYFYDRTKLIGMPDSFTIREMHDLAETVCQGQNAWGVFESVPTAMEELSDRPEHCLDLNFMMALLHTGYEMPIDREVNIAKKIKGNELGWCLGASLPLLEANSGWQCKVKQIQ